MRFITLFLCFITHSFFSFSDNTTLILDRKYQELPNKLRSLNIEELNWVSISGSGQFYEENVQKIRDLHTQEQGIIVDLRLESHGFINNIPVSWTNGIHNNANLNLSVEEVESDETDKLHQYKVGQSIQLALADGSLKQEIVINTVKTERELIETLGLTYIRIPITDHFSPSHPVVDQLVNLMVSLPKDAWVHFHCKAGSGRTTTVLTMLDIIYNHSHNSLEEILDRQKNLGGKDLTDLDPNSFKYEGALARFNFIKTFYDYCEEVSNFQIRWSDWIKLNNNKYNKGEFYGSSKCKSSQR